MSPSVIFLLNRESLFKRYISPSVISPLNRKTQQVIQAQSPGRISRAKALGQSESTKFSTAWQRLGCGLESPVCTIPKHLLWGGDANPQRYRDQFLLLNHFVKLLSSGGPMLLEGCLLSPRLKGPLTCLALPLPSLPVWLSHPQGHLAFFFFFFHSELLSWNLETFLETFM